MRKTIGVILTFIGGVAFLMCLFGAFCIAGSIENNIPLGEMKGLMVFNFVCAVLSIVISNLKVVKEND